MPGVNPYPKVSTPPRNRHVSSNEREIYTNTEGQAMSMFRVSPWVTYEPTGNQVDLHDMDDVDMDAPQISTLREEETPPPQPKSSNPRRGKTTKQAKTTEFPGWVRPRKESHTEEEYEEAEEEEDQLIDDDDDDMMKPVPAAALTSSARSTDVTPKRKTASKRKPRKSGKRITEDEKKTEKTTAGNVEPNPAPTMTWFPATPSENPDEAEGGQIKDPLVPKASPLKKPGRKVAASSALRVKPKVPLKPKTAVPLLPDDVGILSEGHTGTAASSPRFEDNLSEPEVNEPAAPIAEEINLENIPLPMYPLPTKPFPVQLPPKILTGFAPVIPLDKSGKKVRHWRIANREVRGVAGGRWFARSWVGEKESDFASAAAVTAAQAKNGEGVILPRLLGTSISAPLGRGSGRGKASKAASSLSASVAPSRDGSSVPEVPTSTARPPTKMRTSTVLAPPSEGGDSDMTAPVGS